MIGILDSHVHLYDTRRVGSIAMPPDHELYRPFLPAQLRALAEPLGVRGAIVIEVSERIDENQWLLELAAAEPFVVAVVGNLKAGSPAFAERLATFARNPRFRGVRVGTPWCPLDLTNEQLLADLQVLAQFGLAVDVVRVGGGNVSLLEDVLALAQRVPALRVIVDHVPFDLPDDAATRARYRQLLAELGRHPEIFAKVSNVVPRSGHAPSASEYAAMFDGLLATLGPGRLMYGSNWPVSTLVAPYERALRVVLDQFRDDPKTRAKIVFANAHVAYAIPGPPGGLPADAAKDGAA